jgi:hypothetical protein
MDRLRAARQNPRESLAISLKLIVKHLIGRKNLLMDYLHYLLIRLKTN